MEIMKGDKKRETRRQRWAGAKIEDYEWTNEGRQGGSGSQEQPKMEIMKGHK